MDYLGAGAELVNTIATNETQKKIAEETNRTNQAIAEANLDYQREYNEKIWEREDNAVSRRVEDLAKNGISVLADMQGAGSGGTTSAPQNTMTAQSYTIQKPQLDFNEMMNLAEQKRHNLAEEELINAQANKINAEAEAVRQGEIRTQEGYEYEKSRRETEEKARNEEIRKLQEEVKNLKQNKQKTHYETVKTIAETDKIDQEANFNRRTEKDREEIIKQQAILSSLTNDRQRAQLVKDWLENGKTVSEEIREWYKVYKEYNGGVRRIWKHITKQDNNFDKFMEAYK